VYGMADLTRASPVLLEDELAETVRAYCRSR
jgi:hypothetical protein